jgi:hypothetical protein
LLTKCPSSHTVGSWQTSVVKVTSTSPAFAFAGREYKKSLKTTDRRAAEAALALVEITIHRVTVGLLRVPPAVDPGDFILSGGTCDSSACGAASVSAREARRYRSDPREGARSARRTVRPVAGAGEAIVGHLLPGQRLRRKGLHSPGWLTVSSSMWTTARPSRPPPRSSVCIDPWAATATAWTPPPTGSYGTNTGIPWDGSRRRGGGSFSF